MENRNIVLTLDFIRGVGEALANNAWHNSGNTEMYFFSGRNVIKMAGYTYDFAYEDYTADFYIALNGEIIYGKDSECTGPYCIEVYSTGKFERLEDAFAYLMDTLESPCVEKFVAPKFKRLNTNKKENGLVLENEGNSFFFYFNTREIAENEQGFVALSDDEIYNLLEDAFIEEQTFRTFSGIPDNILTNSWFGKTTLGFSEKLWTYPPCVGFELKNLFEKNYRFVCKNQNDEYYAVICDEQKRPLIWEKIKIVSRNETELFGDYKPIPSLNIG